MAINGNEGMTRAGKPPRPEGPSIQARGGHDFACAIPTDSNQRNSRGGLVKAFAADLIADLWGSMRSRMGIECARPCLRHHPVGPGQPPAVGELRPVVDHRDLEGQQLGNFGEGGAT